VRTPLHPAPDVGFRGRKDVGNADPQALQVVVAAREAFVNLGQPEGEIPMTMAVVYLATAPKSNASYRAAERRGARKSTRPVRCRCRW